MDNQHLQRKIIYFLIKTRFKLAICSLSGLLTFFPYYPKKLGEILTLF